MMNKEEMKIRRYTPHTKEDCRRAAECIIELKQRIDKTIELLNIPWILSDYEIGEQVHKRKKELKEILGGKQ